MRGVVVEFGIDEDWLANRSVTDRFPHRANGVAVNVAGRGRKNSIALRRELEQLPAELEIGRERLFRIDMLAGLERLPHDVIVRAYAGQVYDNID